MRYNEEMDLKYKRLLWDIMDIREQQKIKVGDLCERAGITYNSYALIFCQNGKKNKKLECMMSVLDVLGYELTLRKKGEAK